MKSALYQGWLKHQRLQPKRHALRYPVFMLYLDLDEIDAVFNLTRAWSTAPLAPARFVRSDFLGDRSVPLKQAIYQRVKEELGISLNGPVRMLANLRYFGFIMNPLCTYYCFDEHERLVAIVAEVNNTPWGERHSYVLACDPDKETQRITFDKTMHVSPFNPMDMQYAWRSNKPGDALTIHLSNWRNESCEFYANLQLEQEAISAKSLRRFLWRYPLMTLKVFTWIYWHALLLWIKRIPVFDHPKREAYLND